MEEEIQSRIDSLSPWLDRILTILEKAPEGISEYDLIRSLSEIQDSPFPEGLFRRTLSLFQGHFLLFHMLYRLRERLRTERRYELKIACMNIRLDPYLEIQGNLPGEQDRLREYYLDLGNLEKTDEAEVKRMLDDFWKRLQLFNRREEALGVLGLEDPVSFDTIKSRYRKLVMEHHPDRGGDREMLHRINDAMETLARLDSIDSTPP